MTGRLFVFLCAAVSSLLVGCAQVPQVRFDPRANPEVRSIALVDVPERKEHSVFKFAGPPGRLQPLAHERDSDLGVWLDDLKDLLPGESR